MKFFRNKQSKFYFGLVMSSTMFLVSCKKEVISTNDDSGNKQVSSSISSSKTSKYSGEELFRQIMLLENNTKGENIPEYSSYIAKMNELSPEQQLQRTTTCNQIIKEIASLDNNYLNHFKEVILSDDPYAIQNEINNAADIILQVSSNLPQKGEVLKDYKTISERISSKYDLSNTAEIEKFKKDIASELGVKFSEYQELANNNKANSCLVFVLVVAVAAVGVAVAVVDGLWVKSFVRTSATTSLQNQQLVKSLVNNY